MPLYSDGEAAIGAFQRLDNSILWSVRGDDQPFSQTLNSLVMARIH